MRRRTDVGQATVEFALVVPVVILLLVGIVQIGRLVGMQMVMTDAARAGARAAAVDPRPEVAEAAARALLPDGAQVVVRLTIAETHPRVVTVTVVDSFRPVGSVTGSSRPTITVRASSSMAVEAAIGS